MDKDFLVTQDRISKSFEEFKGLTFDEVAYRVGLNPELISSKLSTVKLVNALLAFKKFNWKELENEGTIKSISLKTVRLNSSGKPAESMSFEQVKFMEIIHETWSTSILRKKFSETVILFVVFQYDGNGTQRKSSNLLFKGLKLWKMPVDILDSNMKRLWEQTREVIINGVVLEEIQSVKRTITRNNLPGKTDNRVAHIRPKAKDRNDKTELPCGKFIVKQAYWLNNSYIAEVLKDLPEVERHSAEDSNGLEELSSEQIKVLKSKFYEPIYTIDYLFEKASSALPNFSRFHVNNKNLSKLGYKITPHFIISDEIASVDEYFESVIFNDMYFTKSKTPVFDSPYFNRKIENMENSYELLKVEERMYITNTKLQQAGVGKEMLIDYKKVVEEVVKPNTFFTLASLEADGLLHRLNNYGFEAVFYESILRRPGRLKALKIANQYVFIKTSEEIKLEDFISHFMVDKDSINVDELAGLMQSSCKMVLEIDYLIRIVKSTNYYYSEELKKVYTNKQVYYDSIYN